MKKFPLLILPLLLLSGCNTPVEPTPGPEPEPEPTPTPEPEPKRDYSEFYYGGVDVVDENDFTYDHKLKELPEIAVTMYDVRDIVDYHAFYKIPEFEIKVSNRLANAIMQLSGDFITEIYWHYSELINGVMGITGEKTSNNSYKIKFELYENAKNSYQPLYDFYDDLAYTSYEDDGTTYVNKFVSDDTSKQPLDVYSSQQLFYGVEHGYNVIPMKDSPAEKYYKKAKELLDDIIDPKMDDLTKLTTIFDYIIHTHEYDYMALDHDSGITTNAYPDRDAATDKCYFLEGFFDDNLVVCDGFAKGYTLLGGMLGLNVYRIISPSANQVIAKSNSGHAYCFVNYNGKYYTVCPTWSQSVVNNMVLPNHYTFMVSHDFLEPYNDGHAFEFMYSKSFISSEDTWINLSYNKNRQSIYSKVEIDGKTYNRHFPNDLEIKDIVNLMDNESSNAFLSFIVDKEKAVHVKDYLESFDMIPSFFIFNIGDCYEFFMNGNL